ncbi:MAG TPA: serine hydrolase domain-containing protein [Acidimicrobiales bacterium]|jgi:CubicO group peptidase (beta-lactamase class C family)|nr:serine hydrolase domain-containing protein [Acidimicrobiales bacterium]
MSSLEIAVDPSAFGFSRERLARIKTSFDAYVDNRRLAGWLATVSRGGQLVWSDKGGHRDREKGLEVTDDTMWRIYSMTKPIVAVAVMMLYEEGHFDLIDDVGQWIDSLKEPRVWQGGTSSSHETVAASEPVRVHHLLTHMSGLTYGFNYLHPVDEIYRNKGYDFGFAKDADLVRAVDDWATSPLLFQPGSRWNYSVSFDVLGRLIEIWSGQDLDVFLKERIFDPLAMSDTEWWCPPEKADRLAMLYVPSHGDSFPYDDLARHSLHRPRIFGGGGGLLSTAYDYDRFMNMMLRGGELDGVRLLSSRTLELMTENHLPDDGDLVDLAVDSYTETGYAGQGFGFGMSVMIDRRKNKSLVSEGSYFWGGAASTTFWVDPVEDLTVGFYTQLLPSGTYPIRRDLQRLVYQALSD